MKLIMDKFIMKVSHNINTIRFLALILSRISQYGKKCVKLPTIIDRFRSPDRWTWYFVFRFAFTYYNSTNVLADLLDNTKRKLLEHFKECELAMTEIHQDYDLPLVSYSYTDDTLL